mmetsp:Transcript_60902/g.147268  ORF Transcript_60902/g.147268 Transcript_60902/m.147268 type:complete len:256 (+) Transcript_60902:2041-2808(+)
MGRQYSTPRRATTQPTSWHTLAPSRLRRQPSTRSRQRTVWGIAQSRGRRSPRWMSWGRHCGAQRGAHTCSPSTSSWNALRRALRCSTRQTDQSRLLPRQPTLALFTGMLSAQPFSRPLLSRPVTWTVLLWRRHSQSWTRCRPLCSQLTQQDLAHGPPAPWCPSRATHQTRRSVTRRTAASPAATPRSTPVRLNGVFSDTRTSVHTQARRAWPTATKASSTSRFGRSSILLRSHRRQAHRRSAQMYWCASGAPLME